MNRKQSTVFGQEFLRQARVEFSKHFPLSDIKGMTAFKYNSLSKMNPEYCVEVYLNGLYFCRWYHASNAYEAKASAIMDILREKGIE